jgi:hypothetical protein
VFAILQNKFQILKNDRQIHTIEDINSIVNCCVILHNIMVEKRLLEEDEPGEMLLDDIGMIPTTSLFSNLPATKANKGKDNNLVRRQIANRVATMSENLKNENIHIEMKNNLVLHMALKKQNNILQMVTFSHHFFICFISLTQIPFFCLQLV